MLTELPVIQGNSAVQASQFYPAIEVNTPLSELLHPTLDSGQIKLGALVAAHARLRHMVLRDGMQRSSKIHVLLHKNATPEDAIAAMLHAVLLRRAPSQISRLCMERDAQRVLHAHVSSIKTTMLMVAANRNSAVGAGCTHLRMRLANLP